MGGQKVRDLTVMKKFGHRLLVLRKQKKLTQRQLAIKAGLSTSQIARIETGKLNTTISTLFIISKAMDVELADFFSDFN